MEKFDVDKVYRYIEPGPVVLVTTSHTGNNNIMTMGFHMMMQHSPPLIGAIIGPWDHSFKALKTSKECVVAIPTVDLATTVVDIGNCSGADESKFDKFGLTAVKGDKVSAPLIGECLINIECKVVDDTLVKKYNLFILQPVAAWANPQLKETRTIHHNGNGTFTVDGELINLQERMVKWKQFQG